MDIKPQQIERSLQILVAKPLAWALYACAVFAICLTFAVMRGLRSLRQRKLDGQDRIRGKEHEWQKES